MTKILFAALIVCCVAGCCRPEAATPIDSIALATVTWLMTLRGWKTRRPKGDQTTAESTFKEMRQRVGFVFLRARHLLKANSSWGSEPNQPTLRTRVAADLDQVDTYVGGLVGTAAQRGPLFGGTDPVPSDRQHLEIGALATHVVSDDPPPVAIADAVAATEPDRRQSIVLEHLDQRRDRVLGIAWRAAAIDDELWDNTAKLRRDELAILVDRRLRAIELLRYHVNSSARDDGIGASSVTRTFTVKEWFGMSLQDRVRNEFVDDCEHRVIEPPSVPASEFKASIPNTAVLESVGVHHLGQDVGSDPYMAPHANAVVPEIPWFSNLQTGELDWNIWPGTQILPIRFLTEGNQNNPTDTVYTALPADQQTWQYWAGPFLDPTPTADAPGYAWITSADPSIDRAVAVSKLFTPSHEWWWKPSLHADGALAAVQLEALRFAEYRRTGDNTEFNAFAQRTTLGLDDYFNVRGYNPLPDSPMKPGRGERFDNDTTLLDELQIGDQVLIESLFPFLLADWWEYPTVMISNVDVEAQTGRFAVEGLSVLGFASTEHRFASYRRLLVKVVQDTLDAVRSRISAMFAGGRRPTQLDWDTGRTFSSDQAWSADTNLLQQWSPYEHPWDDPQPWWVRVHLDNPLWRRSLTGDVESVMLRLPKSVAWIDEQHVAVEMGGKVWRLPIAADFQEPPTLEEIPSRNGQPAVSPDPHRCIYVPLWEPFGAFSDGSNPIGWWEFLNSAAVRSDPTPNLQPVRADGAWVQGISGAPNNVRVIRPRIKKL